jgi:hypothetical protein
MSPFWRDGVREVMTLYPDGRVELSPGLAGMSQRQLEELVSHDSEWKP